MRPIIFGAAVTALLADGVSIRDITQQLGCNQSTVYRYRQRLRAAASPDAPPPRATRRMLCQLRYYRWLQTQKCADCSNNDPLVLEPDHVDGKTANVSYLVNSGTWPAIEAELKRCVIRCANCHRRRTHIVGRTYRARLAGYVD